MAKLHTIYKLTITTWTPLHIGTGVTLLRDYDYIAVNGHTYILDTGTLAEALYDEPSDPQRSRFERMIQGARASELVSEAELYSDSPFVRYVLTGEPRSGAQGAQLQEQLKDTDGRAYLPGSSLKGALRTVLAWGGWRDRGIPFSLDDLNMRGRASVAGQHMERKTLISSRLPKDGLAPNYDLLRVLQVSDSTPADPSGLGVLNVSVVRGQRYDPPIELEGVPTGVTFTTLLTLDGFLRSHHAQRIGWSDQMHDWLDQLPQRVNAFTRARIKAELQRWQGNNDAAMISSFYTTLNQVYERKDLDETHEFYLQVGWGGGWDSKTFGDILTADAGMFYQVVQGYQSQMDPQRHFRKGDRYPRSRRLLMRVSPNGETPDLPLGWLRVSMEAR